MDVSRLAIPDILLITPQRFDDARGTFSETYNRDKLSRIGVAAQFVQDNHSTSKERGTIRGLHFQRPPFAQDKLVRVCRGAILDVAVDIRQGSPTFGKAVSAVLSADNWAQLWVPAGFAHGFCTLEPDTEVIYKVSAYYSPECDGGVLWSDPALEIDWPVSPHEAVLSEKDRRLPPLSQIPPYFRYELA